MIPYQGKKDKQIFRKKLSLAKFKALAAARFVDFCLLSGTPAVPHGYGDTVPPPTDRRKTPPIGACLLPYSYLVKISSSNHLPEKLHLRYKKASKTLKNLSHAEYFSLCDKIAVGHSRLLSYVYLSDVTRAT